MDNEMLFNNKYRIPSARLKGWDYRTAAYYFITICTKNREHFFGHIENKQMVLTNLGKIAQQYWDKIPEHFPFVELINFVVMPNHVHGLLYLQGENEKTDDSGKQSKTTTAVPLENNVQTLHATSLPNLENNVQTLHATSLQNAKSEFMRSISPKKYSLPSVIRSYTSAVTNFGNKNKLPNGWQERYHDHIVRNQAEFDRIYNYITNNTANWKNDKFFG
jgi:putative transposase